MSVTVYTQPKYKGCKDLKKLLKQAEIMNAELLESLSPEQQDLLKALPSDPRHAPTVRRLAKRLGRGGNCVSRTLRSFEKRGLVARRTADKGDQNGKVGLVRYCWYRTCPSINGNSVA
jgi:DNA-binding MarR family transcriptional regulator